MPPGTHTQSQLHSYLMHWGNVEEEITCYVVLCCRVVVLSCWRLSYSLASGSYLHCLNCRFLSHVFPEMQVISPRRHCTCCSNYILKYNFSHMTKFALRWRAHEYRRQAGTQTGCPGQSMTGFQFMQLPAMVKQHSYDKSHNKVLKPCPTPVCH